MQNTKDRLKQNPSWRNQLEYFENTIGGVEIDKINGHYTIYPKGKPHEYENLLTTMDITSLEGIALFMQAVTQAERIKRMFKEG